MSVTDPTQPKWFLKSKTVWGAVVATAPIWLQALGIDLSNINVDEIAKWGNDALALIGGAIVIYGRFKANDGAPVALKPGAK